MSQGDFARQFAPWLLSGVGNSAATTTFTIALTGRRSPGKWASRDGNFLMRFKPGYA